MCGVDAVKELIYNTPMCNYFPAWKLLYENNLIYLVESSSSDLDELFEINSVNKFQ